MSACFDNENINKKLVWNDMEQEEAYAEISCKLTTLLNTV